MGREKKYLIWLGESRKMNYITAEPKKKSLCALGKGENDIQMKTIQAATTTRPLKVQNNNDMSITISRTRGRAQETWTRSKKPSSNVVDSRNGKIKDSIIRIHILRLFDGRMSCILSVIFAPRYIPIWLFVCCLIFAFYSSAVPSHLYVFVSFCIIIAVIGSL